MRTHDPNTQIWLTMRRYPAGNTSFSIHPGSGAAIVGRSTHIQIMELCRHRGSPQVSNVSADRWLLRHLRTASAISAKLRVRKPTVKVKSRYRHIKHTWLGLTRDLYSKECATNHQNDPNARRVLHHCTAIAL